MKRNFIESLPPFFHMISKIFEWLISRGLTPLEILYVSLCGVSLYFFVNFFPFAPEKEKAFKLLQEFQLFFLDLRKILKVLFSQSKITPLLESLLETPLKDIKEKESDDSVNNLSDDSVNNLFFEKCRNSVMTQNRYVSLKFFYDIFLKPVSEQLNLFLVLCQQENQSNESILIKIKTTSYQELFKSFSLVRISLFFLARDASTGSRGALQAYKAYQDKAISFLDLGKGSSKKSMSQDELMVIIIPMLKDLLSLIVIIELALDRDS